MDLDDAELMLLVQGGGRAAEEAFEEIVRRNQSALVGFFHRKSWDADDAHDRAQEVFLKVWTARARYQPRASFRAYLFQIARNHWIDVVRARKARPTLRTGGGGDEDRESLIDSQPASDAQPGERAALGELRAQIAAAVATLPEGQREVWELAEDQGLRYSEIGEILGIPVGTVKSRHHHAVRKLRKALREAGLDPEDYSPSTGRTVDADGQARGRG